MGRILIIGRRDHGEKNDTAALAAALDGYAGNGQVSSAYFDDFVFNVDGQRTAVQVRTADKLEPVEAFECLIFFHWTASRILGDVAFSIARYAASKGVAVWNTELLHARSTTKLSQVLLLAQAGLDVPPAVFSLDPELLAAAAAGHGLVPAVCKDVTASRGRRNLAVQDAAQLRQTLSDLAGHPMMVQAFVPNDGSDIRFVISGGKVVLAIKRSGSGESHLNNISAGGKAELLPLTSFDSTFLQEVEQVAGLFNREICGIDYMFDQNKQTYVFLEINGTPQIINGVFADEKVRAIADSLGLVPEA